MYMPIIPLSVQAHINAVLGRLQQSEILEQNELILDQNLLAMVISPRVQQEADIWTRWV